MDGSLISPVVDRPERELAERLSAPDHARDPRLLAVEQVHGAALVGLPLDQPIVEVDPRGPAQLAARRPAVPAERNDRPRAGFAVLLARFRLLDHRARLLLAGLLFILGSNLVDPERGE